MDEDPNAWLLQEFLALDSQGQRRFLSSLIKNLPGSQLRFLYELIQPGLPLDPFTLLPLNVSNRIIRSCDPKTALRIGRVCQNWGEISINETSLWRYFLKNCSLTDVIRREFTLNYSGNLSESKKLTVLQNAFRREFELKENWMKSKYKRIRFPCHGCSVITCLEIDEVNERLFTGSEDHTVSVWRLSKGRCRSLGSLIGHRGGVWAMKVISDKDVLITGSTDRSLMVWDLKSMSLKHQMVGHISTVRCLEIWKHYAISGSRDGTIRIWNWVTGDLIHHISEAHQSSVRCLALFKDGLVVSGSYDNTCALWNVETGQLVRRFEGHTDKIYAVACSHSMIFSGSMDGSVKLWSPNLNQCSRTIFGHRSLVGNLKVFGNYVASASTDGALKVWDISKGNTILNLPTAHPTSITTIDMNKWVLVAGSEGFCRLWHPVTGELLADYLQRESTGMVWRVALGETVCCVAFRKDGETYLDIYDYNL